MRITAETYKSMETFRRARFIDNGVKFLGVGFKSLIQTRGIAEISLWTAIEESFSWIERRGFASPLLAMRITSAKICFGSYFIDDIRYSVLREIIDGHIDSHIITDEDLIYDYIIDNRSDWETDWFTQHNELVWNLCAARQVIPRESPDWPSGEQIFDKLFDAETRTAFHLTDTLRSGIFQMLKDTVSPISSLQAGEQTQLLLAIAQYYDGFRCFDDPLRPRWYGVLNSEDMDVTRWQIQKVYTPEQGN